MWLVNNRNLFLIVPLKAAKSKIMTPADLVAWLVRTHFLVHRFGIVLCPTWWTRLQSSGVFLEDHGSPS